jgi:hypothetical protein
MVTLRQVNRAAEREEQFRALQDALRQTFDCVVSEPVPERLRELVTRLERELNDPAHHRGQWGTTDCVEP